MYLSVPKKGDGFGGEAQGTVPGWFHLAAPEAPVVCSCPCLVLRPGPCPPPTVTSCLNSNCWGLTHGAATGVGRLDLPLPSSLGTAHSWQAAQ